MRCPLRYRLPLPSLPPSLPLPLSPSPLSPPRRSSHPCQSELSLPPHPKSLPRPPGSLRLRAVLGTPPSDKIPRLSGIHPPIPPPKDKIITAQQSREIAGRSAAYVIHLIAFPPQHLLPPPPPNRKEAQLLSHTSTALVNPHSQWPAKSIEVEVTLGAVDEAMAEGEVVVVVVVVAAAAAAVISPTAKISQVCHCPFQTRISRKQKLKAKTNCSCF